MSATITIMGKQVGRRQKLFPDYQIPYPPNWPRAGRRITLRDLLSQIVGEEVAAFRQRQDERRLIRALTQKEISAGVEAGKIDSGGREVEQHVDEADAVATALQAFQNGLYYVFLDDVQKTSLDETVYVSPDSAVLFVRLVALAGG